MRTAVIAAAVFAVNLPALADTYKGSWKSPKGSGGFFTLDSDSRQVDFGGFSCIKKKKLESLAITNGRIVAKVSRGQCGTVTIKIPAGKGRGIYEAPTLRRNGQLSPETGTINITSVN